MNKEMGVNPTSNIIVGNNTYKKYTKENEQRLIERHNHQVTNFIIKYKPKSEEQVIPKVYCIPKMHKNPVKFRFITGAFNSSIKEMSILLKDVLVHFKEHYIRYCKTIESRNNIRIIWSIKSSQELLEKLVHKEFKSEELYTADFASLFTNLPHKTVMECLSHIIKTCFKNSEKRFIQKSGKRFFYNNLNNNNKQ